MHIYTHFDALAGDVLEDEWNGTGRVSNDTHRSLLDFNGCDIGGNHIGNSFTEVMQTMLFGLSWFSPFIWLT